MSRTTVLALLAVATLVGVVVFGGRFLPSSTAEPVPVVESVD